MRLISKKDIMKIDQQINTETQYDMINAMGQQTAWLCGTPTHTHNHFTQIQNEI